MKLAALAAAAVVLPGLSLAQVSNCAPHDVVIERLADGYGEARQSVAITSTGNVVEIFANLDTGTWTVAVTTPGGPTCIAAFGEAFQLVAEPAGVEG